MFKTPQLDNKSLSYSYEFARLQTIKKHQSRVYQVMTARDLQRRKAPALSLLPLTSSNSVEQGTRPPDTRFPYRATGTAPAALLFFFMVKLQELKNDLLKKLPKTGKSIAGLV